MKRFLIIFAVCLMMLSSCARPAGNSQNAASRPDTANTPGNSAQPEEKASDYFPMTEDVRMRYRGSGNEYASLDRYVDYVEADRIQFRDDNGGTVMAVVYQVKDSSVKRVYSRGESYARVNLTSMSNDDEIIIKQPIETGTEWTLKDGAKRSITAVDKPVTTPMGDFTALEVTTERSGSVEQDYYVKGIGFVKKVYTSISSPDFKVVTELEAMDKNVPFNTSANVYYPDYENDKVYYKEIPMELHTNDEPYTMLEEALKEDPEGSSITRVLTPGAEVNGIIIDQENGTMVVDFTPQLISEMNAGAGFESMLLSCIANTLGGYYQAGKVGLTVDGQPYSSGHIIIGTGEYLTVNPSNAVKLP